MSGMLSAGYTLCISSLASLSLPVPSQPSITSACHKPAVLNSHRLTRNIHTFPVAKYHVRVVICSSISCLQTGHSLSCLFIMVTQSGLSGLQQVLINDSSWLLKAFRRMIFQFWAGIQMVTQKYQASISASTLPISSSGYRDNFLLLCIALPRWFTGSLLFGH